MAALAGFMILGLVADVTTISQFGFHLWEPLAGGSGSRPSSSPAQSSTHTLVPEPTATPTPIPPLDRQLAEALSVDGASARNLALLVAAQDAVLRRDYWTAIRAASATPSSSAQAESLAFVARCAIEDGMYLFAAEAAAKIRTTSARDRLKIEVIEGRRRATAEKAQSHDNRADRESMACFGPASE